MNINAVFSGYSTSDIEACKKFYGETLGLTLKDDMGGIGLDVGGHRVFIYPKEDHKPATFTVLNFVVPDINVAIDELVSKGVTMERYDTISGISGGQDERGVMRGKEAGMGPDIAWFKDPTGNILGLIEE